MPTIAVGSVGLNGDFKSTLSEGLTYQPATLDAVVAQVARGDYDMVAVGRALLNDPEWVLKVRDGRFDELEAFSPAALQTLY